MSTNTTASSSVSPDARRLWRATRGPAAIALVIVGLSIALALMRGAGEAGALDPNSVGPSGSRALARLLEAQGVRIVVVHSAAEADAGLAGQDGATLLVTQPSLVMPEQLRQLRDHATDLVVVAALQDSVRELVPSVRTAGQTRVTRRAPACAFDTARAAGVASVGGVRYQVTDNKSAQACYPEGDGAALVHVQGPRGETTTLLGTEAPLTNAKLAEEGNAALAMRLLGRHQRLVWYLPSLADPTLGTGQRSFYDLVPSGWKYGLAQVAVAVVLFALWRARRLGPVVSEPLPVVVRAAETVEGRARLYRRARAADHAAAALRQAARDRLLPILGLPPEDVLAASSIDTEDVLVAPSLGTHATPPAVIETVVRRTGRTPAEVSSLLYGPPPSNDSELIQLADALDALESEVRRP